MTDPVAARYKEALQQGHVAVVRGRPREAVEHYREAGALAPDRPLPFVRMGEVLLQMEQAREALHAFDEALTRAPSDITALRGKAAALRAEGKEADARAVAARATELEAMERAGRVGRRPPDSRLAGIEAHVANGVAARAAGERAIAAAAHLAAASAYAALDHFDAAIDSCLRGLEAQSGNIDIHFLMAMLYLRRGWVELGVERVTLIERRLDIDDDPRRRAALGALARDFRSRSPRLEQLALRLP